MSRHEGVSCDSCLKGNFRGRRYKCLICYDYDLCDTCYETGATNTRHTTDHPVQCILTRSDFDLFYAGESIANVEQPQAYTCPFCSKMGFTEITLHEHVSADHSDTSYEVVCPVCASMPGGDPNFMTDDFPGHLTLEHSAAGRELIALVDGTATNETNGGSGGGGSGSGSASASRHGGRRITHTGHLSGTRGGQSSRPRRSNMHFSIFSTAGLSSLSSSSREPVDPIAELLSQLSGVRRSASNTNSSTSSQLQQLQMHLQLERQQITTARQQLERLPRRPNQSQVTSLRVAASTSSAANSNFGYSLLVNPNANPVQPTASAPPVPSPPSNFLLEGLLEELSLQGSNDQNLSDRYNFADNLLVGTMTALTERIEAVTAAVRGADSNASSTSQPTRVDNIDNAGEEAAAVVPPSTSQEPAPSVNSRTVSSQGRVLRGRARSDAHNATRRIDANKSTSSVPDLKKFGNPRGGPPNGGSGGNNNGGSGTSGGVSKTPASR